MGTLPEELGHVTAHNPPLFLLPFSLILFSALHVLADSQKAKKMLSPFQKPPISGSLLLSACRKWVLLKDTSAFPTSVRVLQDLVEQECLSNCDRWLGLREEITIFLLKFAILPWQGDASLHCLGLPRLRIKSALFFISLLAGSSLWFKSTYHPAWNVHFEGRSFISLSLKTRQSQKEKENRSILAVPGSVTWGWQGPSASWAGTAPSPPSLPRDWNHF